MSYLPDNYLPANRPADDHQDKRSAKYFEPKNLADGEATTLRPCGLHNTGHVIAGWQYFTTEGKPKRSATFPGTCPEDIGLTYEGKKLGTGEKARPAYFLSFVALRKETSDFVVVTMTQKKVREQYEEILKMEDYQPLPSGMCNFYITLKRNGTGTDTSYTVVPTLKAPTKADEQRWAEVSGSIWLPALFVSGDPFGGRPADGLPEGLPPAHRDAYGADHEVATASAMPDSW